MENDVASSKEIKRELKDLDKKELIGHIAVLKFKMRRALKIITMLNRERELLRKLEVHLEADGVIDSKTQTLLNVIWKFRKDMREKEGIQL